MIRNGQQQSFIYDYFDMKAEERGFHYENEQKWRSGVGYISLSVYLYLSLSAAIYQKIYLVVHPMVSAKISFQLWAIIMALECEIIAHLQPFWAYNEHYMQ